MTVFRGAYIWDAQEANDDVLLGLFEMLERLWGSGRWDERFNTHSITLPWAEFLCGRDAPDAPLLTWLERFRVLMPDELAWDDRSITLPGNKPRRNGRRLKEWLSGFWLEQLAYAWLIEGGVPEHAIVRNLQSATIERRSGSGKEVDLLVHYQCRTRVVEIKADLPKGHVPGELENQVSALGDRFGSTRKSLLIGPELHHRLKREQRLPDFQLRCKSSEITLITRREELLHFVLSGH